MVFCIVAIVVFGVLGIFSAKYRTYFFQSLECIRKTLQFKPCEMEFDKKMRAKATGRLARYPKLAGFVYRHFTLISWILIILMIISLVFTVEAIFNLVVYGTCNPLDPSQCVFTSQQMSCPPS